MINFILSHPIADICIFLVILIAIWSIVNFFKTKDYKSAFWTFLSAIVIVLLICVFVNIFIPLVQSILHFFKHTF